MLCCHYLRAQTSWWPLPPLFAWPEWINECSCNRIIPRFLLTYLSFDNLQKLVYHFPVHILAGWCGCAHGGGWNGNGHPPPFAQDVETGWGIGVCLFCLTDNSSEPKQWWATEPSSWRSSQRRVLSNLTSRTNQNRSCTPANQPTSECTSYIGLNL